METVIFHKLYKRGIFRRHVTSDARITNQRVCLTNYSDKGEKVYDNCFLLTEFEDIVTLNNRREGTGYHHGTTFGSYYRGPRNYYGVSNWQSHSVSDIAFIKHGVPVITFRDIEDAHSVVKIAKIAMYSLKARR